MASQKQNPYYGMYEMESNGYIFGRPLGFNKRADPNDRVFQKTILKDNTIVNIIPGIPKAIDQADLAKINLIIKGPNNSRLAQMEKFVNAGEHKAANKLANTITKELLEAHLDCRFMIFEHATAQFIVSYQMLLNKMSTSMFATDTGSNTFSDIFGLSGAILSKIKSDKQNRGFRLWCEKGTTISEGVSHTYGASTFAKYADQASDFVRQLQFGWSNVTGNSIGSAVDTGKVIDPEIRQKMGSAADDMTSAISNISSVTGGATINIPNIWQDSKFNRSYNIAFKFVSPYGDDLSVFLNVIAPFLFLLTCALPRQHGPSGLLFPYILQIDAPGWFSTPMGAIENISFTKGGTDGFLCNPSGLPLVIEGTIGVTDLYANLSLPKSYSEFITNFGTSAFLNNLAGLTLYNTADPTISSKLNDKLKNAVSELLSPIVYVKEEMNSLGRMFGLFDEKYNTGP